LFPFKKIIEAGVAGIMIAHLSVPALAENNAIASSLSKKIITELLDQYGCKCLIFTDGLGMGAITKNSDPGEIELKALLAGNDIVLCPLDVPKSVNLIKQAIKENKLTEHDIDAHVLKILQAKQWARKNADNLDSFTMEKIKSAHALTLKKKLYEAAITLVKNNNNILPIKDNQNPIPVITCGGKENNEFIQILKQELFIEEHHVAHDSNQELLLQFPAKLKKATVVIMSLHAVSRTGMIEIQSQTKEQDPASTVTHLIKKLEEQGTEVIATSFGSAYSIKHIQNASAIIAAYENEPDTQQAAAQAIIGKLKPCGKLPITPCTEFPAGTGLAY
jgi:beta-glucosidase-like glycosyl hydrolase